MALGVAPRRRSARLRLRVPGEKESAVEILGTAPRPRPKVVEVLPAPRGDRMILVFVEHEAGATRPAVARGAHVRARARRGDR